MSFGDSEAAVERMLDRSGASEVLDPDVRAARAQRAERLADRLLRGRAQRSQPIGVDDRLGDGGFWSVEPPRAEEFVARGYRARNCFAHDLLWLPKCGPDGFRLSSWMCGIEDPRAMWELVLYADSSLLTEFPPELFFDDELIWHRQQFGRPGQVATATLVIEGDTVTSLTHVSDLVQRISRRRDHKTQIEKRFKGWNHMLLNAVLHFASHRGCRRVRLASADLVARHTAENRQVDRTMFDRIYDQAITTLFDARRDGDWWVLDVPRVRERIVVPERRPPPARPAGAKTICVFHDVERELGHCYPDRATAARVDAASREALEKMLAVEAEVGVRATYNVVGSIMSEVWPQLEPASHCVAFHSFDHGDRPNQLGRCRAVDYRIKGYRPPRSRITAELTDEKLLWHNFEWVAASPHAVREQRPTLRSGLVRLPISLDDFPLYRGAVSWDEWAQRALALARSQDFVAIGLHDCYAPKWLPRYRDFLLELAEVGELRTLDEVAAEVTLGSAA